MKFPLQSPRGLVPLLLLGASVVTFLLGPGVAARLRSSTHFALMPLGDMGMGITTAVSSRWGGVSLDNGQSFSPSEIRRLIETNIALRGQVDALDSKYQDLQATRRQLDELYGRWAGFECALIPARVVGSEPLPYGSSRLINAGHTSGVGTSAPVTTRRILTDRAKAIPQGLAAVTASSLVGRIINSGAFSARLQLVTDRSFEIHANIHRIIDPESPREVMVTIEGQAVVAPLTDRTNVLIDVQVRGDGADGMIVKDVNAYHKVRRGDWVVTRQADPFLPVRIRIGEITEVQADSANPHFVRLKVRPHADLDALRHVYVVVPLAERAKARR